MSITENVSSAIEPEDRHRVRAIAAALLEHQGFQAAELLDLVIRDESPAHKSTSARRRPGKHQQRQHCASDSGRRTGRDHRQLHARGARGAGCR